MSSARTPLVIALLALSPACRRTEPAPAPAAPAVVAPAAPATPAAPAAPPAPASPTAEAPAATAYAATPQDLTAWQGASTILNVNAAAHFGGGELAAGFAPDPWGFALTAGGGQSPVEVASLGIRDAASGQACSVSSVARDPDFHFTFTAGAAFPRVRFYVVTGNGADATLLINQPDGRWRCNDDHGRADWGAPLMPAIDFHAPRSGRYDVWVGTFDATGNNPATLFVTELDANHP